MHTYQPDNLNLILEKILCRTAISDCYKTQKMCDKAVDTCPPTIKYVPECYKTQEMFYKAVHRCFLYLILFLINIKL